MKPLNIDDKDLVIVGVIAVCICSIYKIPVEAPALIEKAFYGLFGIATGYAVSEVKQLKRKLDQKKMAPKSSEEDPGAFKEVN